MLILILMRLSHTRPYIGGLRSSLQVSAGTAYQIETGEILERHTPAPKSGRLRQSSPAELV